MKLFNTSNLFTFRILFKSPNYKCLVLIYIVPFQLRNINFVINAVKYSAIGRIDILGLFIHVFLKEKYSRINDTAENTAWNIRGKCFV